MTRGEKIVAFIEAYYYAHGKMRCEHETARYNSWWIALLFCNSGELCNYFQTAQ